MTFRIGAYHVPIYVEVDNIGKFTGPIGKLLQDLFSGYIQNITVVWAQMTNDESFFNEHERNSSEIRNMFLKNETDIYFLPIDYGHGPSFLQPMAPVMVTDGVASHSPNLDVRKRDMINSLNIYTPLILSLIGLSILICGLKLLLALGKHFKIEYFWRIGQCLLNQPNFGTKILLISKSLIIFWLIVAFFLMEIYEQAINADAVTVDYSSVVESLDDVVRHEEYEPIFVKNEFITESFKRSLDSKRQKVWKRKSKKLMEMNPMEVMKVGSPKYVHIGAREGAIGATEYFCGQYPGRQYLIASKGFGVVNMALYYRVNLQKTQKDLLEFRSLLLAQAGTMYPIGKGVGKAIASLSPKSSQACFCYSKEELNVKVDTLQPVQVSNMSGFLGLIGLMVSLSILVFLREFKRF